MEKSVIIEKIRNDTNSCVEVKFGDENDFAFKIICGSIHMNKMCFRDVSDIHFCGDTMWIEDKITIDVQNVSEFRVHKERWVVGE